MKEAFPGIRGASPPIMPGKQRLGVYLRGVWGLGAAGARSGGRPGLKGWSGGTAKHGGRVRSRGGRGSGGRVLGRWSLAVRERSSTVTGGR